MSKNIYEEENIARLRPYLAECCVLLKLDDAFPLDKATEIACYGSGIRNTVKGGTGSGEVNSRSFINIEKGLKDAGFTIVNPLWHDEYLKYLAEAKALFKKELKAKAKREKSNIIVASMGMTMREPEYDIPLDFSAEAAIYVVSRISGEGNDRADERGDFRLTESEVRDILILDEKYERFMLVINAGGPVDLSEVIKVRNILVISQLGVETGHALADILLGISNPSGRLTTTWAGYPDYCHIGDFGNKDDTCYREGIYVGYRYFDAAGKKALFPFGYGQSYTEFTTEFISSAASGAAIETEIAVTNTGKRAGKETVQLYLSAPSGKLDREVKSLAAFGKTKSLDPGEKEILKLSFRLTDFAGYDTDKQEYVLEKGNYIVLLGESSEKVTPIAVYQLDEDVTVRKVSNLFAETGFEDWKGECRADYDISSLTPVKLDLSGVSVQQIDYGKQPEISEKIRSLSDEELTYLNIGGFDPKGGILSVIGNASWSVAGAAGESTSMLKNKGIRNLVMADGPAGLRLAREYYRDEKGAHAIGSSIPESILDVMPKIVRVLLSRKPKLKKGTEVFQQFATALPIETAIAQSWNEEFARLCGDIVGKEMEVFNVDLWLAPAMNIHRNVLCGRNFEYLSEDPLISGKMAAAITQGVQQHPGRGVTIKHFACNNQETNRYANNSVVSERALREIYLKGFAICIEESRPAALMTSYNLVNWTHTSESRALTTDYLFDELDYDGVVMTDWVIGGNLLSKDPKYPAPDAARVAAAGGSLFMPGSKKEFREITDGLKNGTVSREQLELNGQRLLNVIKRLSEQE